MNHGNFDRLKESIRVLIDKYRSLKFRNIQLEQENKELKDRLKLVENLPMDEDIRDAEKLKRDIEKLKAERDEVKQRLQRLIAELESLS